MKSLKFVLFSVISLLSFNACSDSNTAITADVEDVADTQDIQIVDVPVVGTDAVFDDTFHCLNNGQCDDGNPCTQDQCYNGGEKPVCKNYIRTRMSLAMTAMLVLFQTRVSHKAARAFASASPWTAMTRMSAQQTIASLRQAVFTRQTTA